MKILIILSVACVLIFGSCQVSKDEVVKKPNVFLIYVDDLRPELGAYGNQSIISPNIDALGADAVIFNNAYANIPVCGASRASMLTGIMPNRNRFVGYLGNAQQEAPDAVTIPAFLKNQGYRTHSLGKVFHDDTDSEYAWSEKPYRGPKKSNKDYALQINIDVDNKNPKRRSGAFEMADTVDEAYLDGKLALKAIEMLRNKQHPDSSLFMAVGFWKPHLPFTPPKKYWDMYDRSKLPFPTNYFVPENAPEGSTHQFAELRSYTDIPNDSLPLDTALVRKLIHGYYASVTYTDRQIGKLINELKEQNLYDESIIILVGDHGWFLGEHTMWCKHANFKNALRTTLMIKFPKNARKGMTDLPVSLIELYPSIVEMLGLDAPDHLDAESFLESLKENTTSYKNKEIYCRYQDGETLLKGKYAYTEYYNDAGEMYGNMLYDHSTDPDENKNIVDEVDPTLVAQLSNSLANQISTYK